MGRRHADPSALLGGSAARCTRWLAAPAAAGPRGRSAMNVVVLHGTLSRDPEERMLPSGDRLLAYEVTVREEGQPTDSVPVTWLDPPAKAASLEKGAEIV